MVAEKKTDKKKAPVEKDQLVCVGPEHQPMLRELLGTYGTNKNVVGKALECLYRQQQQQAAASGT